MIGRLRGVLLEKQPPGLVLDVQGVGYELEAPMSTFYELPGVGDEVTLFTHLLVREDAQTLYGFFRDGERRLFRTLLKVNGVGAKMALAILSGMSANEFALCVQNNDLAALTRLPGIGKKTAERLVIEMRDRLAASEVSTGTVAVTMAHDSRPQTPRSDAISALIALGYKPQEAERLVKSVAEEGMGSEQLIRAALRGAATP